MRGFADIVPLLVDVIRQLPRQRRPSLKPVPDLPREEIGRLESGTEAGMY